MRVGDEHRGGVRMEVRRKVADPDAHDHRRFPALPLLFQLGQDYTALADRTERTAALASKYGHERRLCGPELGAINELAPLELKALLAYLHIEIHILSD